MEITKWDDWLVGEYHVAGIGQMHMQGNLQRYEGRHVFLFGFDTEDKINSVTVFYEDPQQRCASSTRCELPTDYPAMEAQGTMTSPTSEESGSAYKEPEPGRWTIDTVHSFVTFSVFHMNVSYARGIAVGPAGAIVIAPDLLDSSVEASIDVSTLTTLNPVRDSKMRGPELLDVKRYPTIEFVSTGLWSSGENYYELGGRLTIHGVTKDVSLDLAFNGVVTDTWGKQRLGVTATTELSREDFGAGEWGHVLLPSSSFMVPHHLSVTLDIEATKDDESE